MTGQEIAQLARGWVGTPFKHQGRNQFGVDCIGLLVVILEQAACMPPGVDQTNYGRRAAPDLERLIREHCTPVRRPEAGTLILIRFPRVHMPQHVALHTGSTMIHACQRNREVVEHGYEDPWVKHTVGLFRLPGVTYE